MTQGCGALMFMAWLPSKQLKTFDKMSKISVKFIFSVQAPEVYKGGTYTEKADVYSYALVCYFFNLLFLLSSLVPHRWCYDFHMYRFCGKCLQVAILMWTLPWISYSMQLKRLCMATGQR